jgi:hypothetical protein
LQPRWHIAHLQLPPQYRELVAALFTDFVELLRGIARVANVLLLKKLLQSGVLRAERVE